METYGDIYRTKQYHGASCKRPWKFDMAAVEEKRMGHMALRGRVATANTTKYCVQIPEQIPLPKIAFI
jgi:hypothetical protein